MNRLETLKALKKLFSKSSRWTQNDMALNREGNSYEIGSGHDINPCDEEAVCFCLLGGIAKVTGTRNVERLDANTTVKLLAKQLGVFGEDLPTTTIVNFNDGSATTIGDVRRLINLGIKELSK